jgi:hypothetical protein
MAKQLQCPECHDRDHQTESAVRGVARVRRAYCFACGTHYIPVRVSDTERRTVVGGRL